jgi:hypothetical protein
VPRRFLFHPRPSLLIGTFGAVIRIRGGIPSRRALFDIAAAGPIAGFVVALPVLVIGVARAIELPPEATFSGAGLGPPLVSWFLERVLHGQRTCRSAPLRCGLGRDVFTSMNLFPVGQLTGHALFALSPRAHKIVSWCTIVALAVWVVVHSRGASPSATRCGSASWCSCEAGTRACSTKVSLGAARTAVAVLPR